MHESLINFHLGPLDHPGHYGNKFGARGPPSARSGPGVRPVLRDAGLLFRRGCLGWRRSARARARVRVSAFVLKANISQGMRLKSDGGIFRDNGFLPPRLCYVPRPGSSAHRASARGGHGEVSVLSEGASDSTSSPGSTARRWPEGQGPSPPPAWLLTTDPLTPDPDPWTS